MAGKDKKAKAAEKKARKAKSQDKKQSKTEKKGRARRTDDGSSDEEGADLDAVLAEYARKQERFLRITETVCEPPSPRASAALLGNPANENELFLFGGEYWNGALASFYNELFVYNVNRDEWRVVTSPNSPLPRSGHAWCRGGNAGGIYLYGGEFSSPKQGTFYHYNDFWRLEPGTREWTRLEGKGKGPSARSGHRLTYFKNFILLFGGFQDTSQSTRYLNDLWIYDCTTFTWHEPKLPPATGRPDARSSFTFLPHDGGAVLCGGYSRVKTTQHANPKGARGGAKTVDKAVVHQDTWYLRIAPPPADAPAGSLPTVRWERRKRPANAPVPVRAGATMCAHHGRGIMFGGVHDVEESEEGIESEFFNQLFAWNIDRNRYFGLSLRRPRAAARKTAPDRARRDRGKQTETELWENLRALEMKAAGLGKAEGGEEVLEVAAEEVEVEQDRPEKPVVFEMPHPRFNAQLAVQGDTLYLYGGIFERDDREFTFDEMWAVDLGKLDGVREIFRRELADWQGSDDEEDSDAEEGEDSEEDEEGGEEGLDAADANASTNAQAQEEAEAEAITSRDATAKPPRASTHPSLKAEEDETEEVSTAAGDGLPYPRPFEALRDFYARTGVQWQELVLAELSRPEGEAQSGKEIKKKAFDRAQEKWWESREEIRALEDEQEAAGIGDVVSLADKAQSSGPAAKRR